MSTTFLLQPFKCKDFSSPWIKANRDVLGQAALNLPVLISHLVTCPSDHLQRFKGSSIIWHNIPTCLWGRSSWCTGWCGQCNRLCHQSLWLPPSPQVVATPSLACQPSLHVINSPALRIITKGSLSLPSASPEAVTPKFPGVMRDGLGHNNNPQ